ncbi:hypothetical protein EDB81DRAFT_839971 [Dactylonectria macrodidyma]|uniref:Uncharacterized protein n=1 Tax=Dactylonectria macrodidyma TaxID=307937 RepID=A0A9P9JDQ4_9HYPO|nr:hypothetical protein EDB81DRAFT_839971 [Dactylonectria macrodidyma]
MTSSHDWDRWFETEHPALDGSASGLVLILARRNGERELPTVNRAKSDEWLEMIKQTKLGMDLMVRSTMSTEKSIGSAPTHTSGLRTLRILPFSEKSFTKIVRKFYIHDTIARTVSRADIPTFSAVEVEMGAENGHGYPAFGNAPFAITKEKTCLTILIVYNCRTSNAWDGDLALSATYFPHCGLTFAVMFGCPMSIEEQVLRRLGRVTTEASHSLLMPGILIELERSRHVQIVEDAIDVLEARIQEIDLISEDSEAMSAEEQAKRKEAKRSAWLDTMYVRNQLINWITNLEKLFRHADELNNTVFNTPKTQSPIMDECKRKPGESQAFYEEQHDKSNSLPRPKVPFHEQTSVGTTSVGVGENVGVDHLYSSSEDVKEGQQRQHSEFHGHENDIGQAERMRRTGNRIKNRVRDIIDEYHEKVRDCTLRVDGMTMATQWAQGETNVEIAMAAGRDSRHMRSIALVTMIFLPGTFFASIFSMGFFDWRDSGSGDVVSRYFWIYVVLAVGFTAATLGIWWYLGVHRHSRRRKKAEGLQVSFA